MGFDDNIDHKFRFLVDGKEVIQEARSAFAARQIVATTLGVERDAVRPHPAGSLSADK